MASFTSLPPEILHVIIEHIPCQSPYKTDLVNLSYVCKSLHTLMEPYLYREIKWSWLGTSPFDDLPIHPLLKSLLRRPELAAQVHHVCFKGWHDRRIWELGSIPAAEESKPLRVLIHSANLPDQARWMQGILMGKSRCLGCAADISTP
jgi:hypothetical protein